LEFLALNAVNTLPVSRDCEQRFRVQLSRIINYCARSRMAEAD
jgi:hypothetical protein